MANFTIHGERQIQAALDAATDLTDLVPGYWECPPRVSVHVEEVCVSSQGMQVHGQIIESTASYEATPGAHVVMQVAAPFVPRMQHVVPDMVVACLAEVGEQCVDGGVQLSISDVSKHAWIVQEAQNATCGSKHGCCLLGFVVTVVVVGVVVV